ncbi:tetratricopeptide repeat protein [Nocardia asiatica]|uniref:tetratricopeptide repeat protein n=1 Tax=Nocardia asiatica TaxID=209252 RepID=UPI0024560702|nr:tetratricopeptide repeat protein [Nocardia asiatica]
MGVLIVLGATGIGLGIWLFVSLDLDEGDKLASVVGMFVGIAALGISIYGVVLARRDEGSRAVPSPGGTSITGSVIGGVSTITDVAGPVTNGGPGGHPFPHPQCLPDHDPAAVSAYLLGLEYADWADRFERKLITTSPEVMRRVAHLATLTGGMSHSDARSLLSSTGLAVDEAHAGRIVDDHSLCYPPTTTSVLTPLQPDRLGEDFLALNTPGKPDHADDALPADPWTVDAAHQLIRRGDGATPPWVGAAIVPLVEAAGRWPHLATTLLYPSPRRDPLLAATTGGATLTPLVGLPGIAPDILTVIRQHLTDNPGLDTTTAATVLDTALLPHRIASTADPAERADLHRRYSRQLRAAHRYRQALTAAEQSAELYRSLYYTDPVHYGPSLAAALEILGTRWGDVGRHTEALGPAQEAVDLHRQLAETGTYLPELGNALNPLGIRMGSVGRNHEALSRPGRRQPLPPPGRSRSGRLLGESDQFTEQSREQVRRSRPPSGGSRYRPGSR